jgi:hypothetical protein
LSEGLGPTRTPEHEQAISFLAYDRKTVPQIQALSVLIDPKNAQSHGLVQLVGFVDDLMQQACANAKPSTRCFQVELYQPEVVGFVLYGYKTNLCSVSHDDAIR